MKKEKLFLLIPVPIPFDLDQIRPAIEKVISKPFEICFLHVIDLRWVESLIAVGNTPGDKFLKEYRENAKRATEELCKSLDGIESQAMVVEGIPFLEIIKIAKDLKADTIIMKTRSQKTQNAVEEYFFGSTTEKVVRSSPIPVLCIP